MTPFSKARLEALSDGVFAIAMTLLVLALKIPELPRRSGSHEIWQAVLEHWPIFFSYLVTFLLAGQFWLWQHVAFHYTRGATQSLALITIFFLMFVSLLPFSTAMLGSFSLRQPVTLAMYFGNQLALGLLMNAHWWYAKRRRLLSAEPYDPAAAKFGLQIASQPIACAAAVTMAALKPEYSFSAFVLLQAFGTAIARRRARRASSGAAVMS